MNNIILQGDCLEKLKEIPDNHVQMCVTSPPYYNLRDYGTAEWIGGDENCNHYRDNKVNDNCDTGHKNIKTGVSDSIYKDTCPKCGAVRNDQQIGLESTPEEYIQKLVDIFREVRRVLKDDGTLWVNIGDTYAGSNKGSDGKGGHSSKQSDMQSTNKGTLNVQPINVVGQNNLKPKDLIGIPWLLAFALRNDGWYLRQDIIWSKPNPMPESVTDRCTKAHEYIFLLSKSRQYLFNHEAIQTDIIGNDHDKTIRQSRKRVPTGYINGIRKGGAYYEKANKRSVWTVTVKPTTHCHFATFPQDLIADTIKAGSNENDIVLDPFMGSGTTAVVARKFNRNYIGVELNPEYIQIAHNYIYKEMGAFI